MGLKRLICHPKRFWIFADKQILENQVHNNWCSKHNSSVCLPWRSNVLNKTSLSTKKDREAKIQIWLNVYLPCRQKCILCARSHEALLLRNKTKCCKRRGIQSRLGQKQLQWLSQQNQCLFFCIGPQDTSHITRSSLVLICSLRTSMQV